MSERASISLAKILWPKKANFPYVSWGLLVSCLLISIPLFFSANYYLLLGAEEGINLQFWQVITSHFAHGPSNPSLPIHLITNVIVVVFFGVAIERSLGSGRLCLLSLATFLTNTTWRVQGNWGNGVSGVCWGYVVFMVLILSWLWSKRKVQNLTDGGYIVAGIYSGLMLVGLPLVLWLQGLGWQNGTNVAHLISILTAVPLAVIWRKTLFANLSQIEQNEAIKQGSPLLKYMAIATSIGMVAFNTLITSLVSTGLVVYECDQCPQVLDIAPTGDGIKELNEHNRQIMIKFNQPMEQKIYSYSINTQTNTENGELDFWFSWSESEILVVQFNRNMVKGESITLKLDGFKDINGWKMIYPLELTYD